MPPWCIARAALWRWQWGWSGGSAVCPQWESLPASQAVASGHGSGSGMLLLGSSPWRQGILCCPWQERHTRCIGIIPEPCCCRNPAEPTVTWLPLVQGLRQSPAVPAVEQVSGT